MSGFMTTMIEGAKRSAEKAAIDTFEKHLPAAIETAVKRSLAQDPGSRLTAIGFRWAWWFEMEKLWPGVTRNDLTIMLRDYLPAPVGTPGYDWSIFGARELARAYVEEFGEVA